VAGPWRRGRLNLTAVISSRECWFPLTTSESDEAHWVTGFLTAQMRLNCIGGVDSMKVSAGNSS
jgi:hypothetical protein